MCDQKRNDGSHQFGKFRTNDNREHFNKRVQLAEQEEYDDDCENNTVLNVEGDEENVKPHYVEEFITVNRFKTIIDSGLPVTTSHLIN